MLHNPNPKTPKTAHLSARVPDGRDVQVVPEGRPVLPVVEQPHRARLLRIDCLAHFSDGVLVRLRPLEEPAVSADHLLARVPWERRRQEKGVIGRYNKKCFKERKSASACCPQMFLNRRS